MKRSLFAVLALVATALVGAILALPPPNPAFSGQPGFHAALPPTATFDTAGELELSASQAAVYNEPVRAASSTPAALERCDGQPATAQESVRLWRLDTRQPPARAVST